MKPSPKSMQLAAPMAAVLPVGELEAGQVRDELEAILGAFRYQGSELIIGDPIVNEEGARRSVSGLLSQNPDLLVLVPLRGLSAAVMEAAARMCPVPVLIWPVREHYALPSSALAIGALREAGPPAELLYGPPDHPVTVEKLRAFIRAARVYTRLRQSRIGVIGGLFPNLVACRYDADIIHDRLGVTLHSIPFSEVRQAIQMVSGPELEAFQEGITGRYTIRTGDTTDLVPGCRLHLALKQMACDRQFDGYVTECWSGFPRELGLNPCLGFAEDDYPLACEGDAMLGVLLLIVRYLIGITVFVGDLYDLDLEGILTLVHCGAPAGLAKNASEVILGRSELALERGFTTFTCRPRLETGAVTLLRFSGQNCDRMHLATGELIDCEQSPTLKARIRIAGDRWDFLKECSGNHYAVVPGEIESELKLLCEWLRITLVVT
jgi:L-fucose isomerase-like protein